MKVFAVLLSLTIGSTALAIHPSGFTMTGEVALSASTTGDTDKDLMIAAKDEARAFIATNGQVGGANLDKAIQRLRQLNPDMTIHDLDGARQVILETEL